MNRSWDFIWVDSGPLSKGGFSSYSRCHDSLRMFGGRRAVGALQGSPPCEVRNLYSCGRGALTPRPSASAADPVAGICSRSRSGLRPDPPSQPRGVRAPRPQQREKDPCKVQALSAPMDPVRGKAATTRRPPQKMREEIPRHLSEGISKLRFMKAPTCREQVNFLRVSWSCSPWSRGPRRSLANPILRSPQSRPAPLVPSKGNLRLP